MVNVSNETPEQTHERLLGVIAQADFRVLEGTYAFEEMPVGDFPHRADPGALAHVRDDEVFSQLVRSGDPSRELFGVASFHFRAGQDNSGFVGWLASHLKRELGTGVFVVCGQNSGSGGIFDYWGYPVELAGAVTAEVRRLIELGKRADGRSG